MTAMMLLIANSMHKPQHDKLFSDTQLIKHSLQTLDQMVEETQSVGLRSLRETCVELNKDALRRRGETTSWPTTPTPLCWS